MTSKLSTSIKHIDHNYVRFVVDVDIMKHYIRVYMSNEALHKGVYEAY